MEIKQDSIIDFSQNFKPLQDSIASTNYNVSFSARAFAFENDARPFDLTCFRKVYYDVVKQECSDACSMRHTNKDFRYRCISGSLEKRTTALCIEEINIALAFDFDSDLCSSQLLEKTTTDIEIYLQKRKKIFWSIVEQYFTISTSTQIWFHKPDFMCFFQWGIMWEFCFVFINNATKQGLVLTGDAYD